MASCSRYQRSAVGDWGTANVLSFGYMEVPDS
jgi:hypothetical protein